jgi:hypothetical protein
MIAQLISVFAALITSYVEAQGDKAKEETALMVAEERLSRLRAKMKFGG